MQACPPLEGPRYGLGWATCHWGSPISQGHGVYRGGDPDSRTLDSGPQGCGVLSSSHEMGGKVQNL